MGGAKEGYVRVGESKAGLYYRIVKIVCFLEDVCAFKGYYYSWHLKGMLT